LPWFCIGSDGKGGDSDQFLLISDVFSGLLWSMTEVQPATWMLRKLGRRSFIVILALLGSAAGILVVRLLRSRRESKALSSSSRQPITSSISEKLWVTINGVPQGMFIESQNRSNPVLLVVHGGPGVPDHFLTERYPTGLEKLFTVVWWEQRGTGLSYTAGIPLETMTVDQFISDNVSVSNYLRSRFRKEKIYLLGHSWGSYIAIQAAAKAPELYAAYVGMAQMSYQLESERLAYEYMLQQFKGPGRQRNGAQARECASH
jgi:dipeptidyl aminopeptidase/acylaminoacyl peptidase